MGVERKNNQIVPSQGTLGFQDSIEVYNYTHTNTKGEPPYSSSKIRVASWFQPFLDVALKSMNGLTEYRCNNISTTPHHPSRQIHMMSESPPSIWLTTPIRNMCVYTSGYTNSLSHERSLGTPRATSLEIQHW